MGKALPRKIPALCKLGIHSWEDEGDVRATHCKFCGAHLNIGSEEPFCCVLGLHSWTGKGFKKSCKFCGILLEDLLWIDDKI